MNDNDVLAEHFERNRSRLRAVAYRMLGSLAEADDAVQETWLRLSRADTDTVANLDAWLTTVVGRICLDMLRSRTSRREEPIHERIVEPASVGGPTDPEQEALLADAVGLALIVVLESLTPAERLAFVLHDMFAVSFDEIAPIVGRSPAAARQLASRARRRVRAGTTTPETDLSQHREIVDAFLAAARAGEFAALLTLLDPDVVVRADEAAARLGAPAELRGAERVAALVSGGARAAVPAYVDGAAGVVVRTPSGKLFLAISLSIVGGRIIAIDVVADRDQLGQLDVELVDA